MSAEPTAREALLSLAAEFERRAAASPPDAQRAAFLACAALAHAQAPAVFGEPATLPPVSPDAAERSGDSGAVLLPAENICLTVARGQLMRGENPPINTTAMLVMALDRLTGREDWTAQAQGDPDD